MWPLATRDCFKIVQLLGLAGSRQGGEILNSVALST